MCGITGFIGQGNREIIKKMADTLRHRGPDDEGFFMDEADHVCLGFRRLAIIDLDTGAQPMTNEDGSIAIVFNGEIYNFKELREDLEKRHVFKTRSDTEVIVHLYEEEGEGCFKKFNGMFAIAVWDKKKKRIVLARDRMGEKPLYWAKFGDTFLFASEAKAILAHPSAKKILNRAAAIKYFFFLSVPSPWTIYEGVYKLEPGQVLVYSGGEMTLRLYWKPKYDADPRMTLHDAMRETDRLLEDATRLRLASDVPLGIFLSGGIDSGAVAYYAAQASKERIKTFSIGFEVPTFDESAYAKAVSERIGSEHHVEVFGQKTLFDLIPQVTQFMDEPLSDSALLPTYLLSKFTRRHVTVALGGDGGDELFLGYPTFQAHRIAEWYRRLPRVIGERFLPYLGGFLPVRHEGLSLDYKIKAFLSAASLPVGVRQQIWISTFHGGHLQKLFAPGFVSDIPPNTFRADIDADLEELSPKNTDEAAMFLYERYFLGDQVLTKVDRASMAASLEVRAPFLDHRLVEFAHRIPASLRLRFWQNKYLLKRLMRGKLPDEIMDRPKKGFWVPIGLWLKKELKPMLAQYLGASALRSQGIFQPEYVQKLIHEHERDIRDHRKILWSLLMFQLWQESWM